MPSSKNKYSINTPQRISEPVHKRPIRMIMLELFKELLRSNVHLNGTRKHLLNRNAFLSGYSVISAGGFRFLILPLQLTPSPVYPGLHVQL